MEWRGRRQSGNVEDVRGSSPSRGGLGGSPFGRGGGFRIPTGGGRGGGMSIGTIIFLVVIYFVLKMMGIDLLQVMESGQVGSPGVEQTETQSPRGSAQEEETKAFVATVLAETEDTWNGIFQANGETYQEPKLVLFRDGINSACGMASSASGPFYCPGDYKVYLDMAFFDELAQRFDASGDFAEAYVIAHEVGHHVQNLLGISEKVQRARSQLSEAEYNKLSVKLELQADFLAGVWAHHTQKMANILDPDDIDEALNAANAIGDDRLQKQSRGYVVPDAFTHGTSAQRMYWFKKGYQTGDIKQGDTFNSNQ